MKENIDALDEIHKGACMGVDALTTILKKVKDSDFHEVLDNKYNEYARMAKRIEKIYSKYDKGEPHETNAMNKVMTWGQVELETLGDASNSKIAELMLQGVNMGIIEGRKILNNKVLNSEVYNIVSEYVTMQESNMEELKKYL